MRHSAGGSGTRTPTCRGQLLIDDLNSDTHVLGNFREGETGLSFVAGLFVADGRGTIGITYFQNRLRDLIAFEGGDYPELGRSVNVARARTEGVELTARIRTQTVDLRAAYTYLDARDLTATDPTERRLIRRPRHAAGADLLWTVISRLDLGAGVTAVLDRRDTDFNVFPAIRVDPGDYVDARVQAAYRLAGGAAVRLAVENLFDQRYEEVYGFPALGRRLSATLELGGR